MADSKVYVLIDADVTGITGIIGVYDDLNVACDVARQHLETPLLFYKTNPVTTEDIRSIIIHEKEKPPCLDLYGENSFYYCLLYALTKNKSYMPVE